MSNKCCSGAVAIAFLESLLKVIPKEIQDETFRDQYDSSMNRIRYEVSKGSGVKPKAIPAMVKRYGIFYKCGKCGRSLAINDNYCRDCGTAVMWLNPRCLTHYEDANMQITKE